MNHVFLTCENHPDLFWHCKEIAVSNGRYNGCRNIFFAGVKAPAGHHWGYTVLLSEGGVAEECSCPAASLIEVTT